MKREITHTRINTHTHTHTHNSTHARNFRDLFCYKIHIAGYEFSNENLFAILEFRKITEFFT